MGHNADNISPRLIRQSDQGHSTVDLLIDASDERNLAVSNPMIFPPDR
jgi:hypothetical protein